MVIINPVPLPPYGGHPYTNITPFTYRDGWTFQRVLEELRKYIRDVVAPHLDLSFDQLESYVNTAVQELVDYVDGIADAVDVATAQAQAAQAAAEIAKAAAEAAEAQAAIYASQAEEIQDVAISNIAGNSASVTRGVLDGLYTGVDTFETLADVIDTGRLSVASIDFSLSERKRIYRPEAYGAIGDGVEDDTTAFNSMFSDMVVDGETRGTVEFNSKSTYLVSSGILILTPNNLIINGNGASLTATTNMVIIGNQSASGAKGYGAGGNNVEFRDFTIYGGYNTNLITAFHHVSNLTFRNVNWIGAIGNTHAIDLGGCNGVTVTDCEFRGNHGTDPSMAYAEAIQVDASTYGGSSLKASEPSNTYDGLPTINVKVIGNRFTRTRFDNVDYPMPLPIGSHNFALQSGGYYENIRFENNECFGWVMHVSAGWAYGWVHLHGAKNVSIKNNRFEYNAPNEITDPQFVINNRPVDLVTPLAEVANGAPTQVQATTPYVAMDWTIDNNEFIGFEDSVFNAQALILFRSASTGSDALYASERNIIITNNVALNVNGAVLRMQENLTLDYPRKFVVKNNVFSTSSFESGVITVLLSGNGIFSDNSVSNPPTRGVCMDIRVGKMTINSNTITGGDKGVTIRGINNSVMSLNSISEANSGVEIGTTSGAETVTDSVFTMNIISNCATRSMRAFAKSARNVVFGNRAVNSPAVSDAGSGNLFNDATNTTVTV